MFLSVVGVGGGGGGGGGANIIQSRVGMSCVVAIELGYLLICNLKPSLKEVSIKW